jgi:2'-5' RNA ligase
MRVFAAIDLDESARLAVAAVQTALGSAVDRDSLRWVQPEQMHITLVFVGEVSLDRAAHLSARLSQPVAQAPFDLRLQGLGAFPSRGAPRALWIGVREGGDQVQRLQREIADRMKGSADPVVEPFRAHLTLARFRRSRPSDRHVLLDQSPPEQGIRLTVDHVTLYESVLSSGPPRYTALARANLTSL